MAAPLLGMPVRGARQSRGRGGRPARPTQGGHARGDIGTSLAGTISPGSRPFGVTCSPTTSGSERLWHRRTAIFGISCARPRPCARARAGLPLPSSLPYPQPERSKYGCHNLVAFGCQNIRRLALSAAPLAGLPGQAQTTEGLVCIRRVGKCHARTMGIIYVRRPMEMHVRFPLEYRYVG
jgi:hypothetical protein